MKIIIIPFIFFFALHAVAETLPVQNYTTHDGMISNFVTEIYQDSRGYLWIGTDEGISIFDGHKFRNIIFDESKVWGDVNAIIESKFHAGEMWIGMNGGGLIHYRNGKSTSFSVDTVEVSNKVNSILEMDDSSLWLATDNGLYHFVKGTSQKLINPKVGDYLGLVRDATGRIWCTDGLRLFLFLPESRTLSIPDIKDLPKKNIYRVNALKDSSIAVVVREPSNSMLFIVKNLLIKKKIIFRSGVPSNAIQDQNNKYWVRTSQGLKVMNALLEEKHSRLFPETNGLPLNDLTGGYIDRDNNLWFGTLGRGIVKINATQADHLSFSELSVRSVSDRSSHIWVPSLRGLYEVWKDSNALWQHHLHPLKTENGAILRLHSVVLDAHEHLWLSDDLGSLHYFSVERTGVGSSRLIFQHTLSEQKGFPRALGVTMMIDSKNILWYGLDKASGLVGVDFSARPTIIASFKHKENFPIRDVRELYEDKSGNIWVMGYEAAYWLIKRVNDRFVIDSVSFLATMLPKIPYRSVLQTKSGVLWFGSRYQGLYSYDGSSVRHFTKKDGMISNQIWSMAETPDGGILLGTNGGLMLMPDHKAARFTSLQHYASSPVRKVLSTKEFSFALTRYGVHLFSMPIDSVSSEFPQIYFTSLFVNGKEHPLNGDIALSSGENTIAIDYTATSFRNAEALRFQYRLEPLERHWREAATIRSVTYTNLLPGKYSFVVRVLNQKGEPSELPATLHFSIASPLWQQWWFIILCGIAITAIVLAIEHFRVRRLLEIEKIRSRIAADLHDDIGSGLTRIALLSDVIQRQTGAAKKADSSQFSISSLSEKVGTISRELVDEMSDVVWSIDPKNNSVQKLLQRVQTFATEVCDAKEISLRFNAAQGIEHAKVDSDSIRAVLLFVKEALTNVVRHSESTRAELSLQRLNNLLIITIVDNGKGFDPDTLQRMSGLTNMRTRIEKTGGIFSINSVRREGTTVQATIPLLHKN